MRPLQNILYITKPGAYLSKERETIHIRLDEGPDMKIPIHGISGIVCFGTVGMSPWLMGFCAERNVDGVVKSLPSYCGGLWEKLDILGVVFETMICTAYSTANHHFKYTTA